MRNPEYTLATIVVDGKRTMTLLAKIPVRAALAAFLNGLLAGAVRTLMLIFFLP